MDDADIARHHDVDETFGPKDPKGQCRCLSRMSLLQSSDGNGGALYPSRGRFSASHAPVGLRPPCVTPRQRHIIMSTGRGSTYRGRNAVSTKPATSRHANDIAHGHHNVWQAFAEREPELARQLPRFVSEVRRIFEADEIRFHLARLEREQEAQELVSHDAENFDEDEVFSEDSETSAARARSFILTSSCFSRHSSAHLNPPPWWVSAAADWTMSSPYLAYFNLMTFVDVASAVSGRAALRRKPGATFHWRRSSVMTVTVRLL
jgi:hypothetical protein